MEPPTGRPVGGKWVRECPLTTPTFSPATQRSPLLLSNAVVAMAGRRSGACWDANVLACESSGSKPQAIARRDALIAKNDAAIAERDALMRRRHDPRSAVRK